MDDNVTMNEFLVQINNILNNPSLPRHNVAADMELPVDLPPDLWTADRVWVRCCGLPRLHPNTELPPLPTRERRRVFFDLTPQPAATDSETVFPAQHGKFFERLEEATKSRYPRRQQGPPPGLKD
jgi:hypothetical protein